MVEKISWSELPPRVVRGPVPQLEFQAVQKLEPGEAIKFPCRWKHSDRGAGHLTTICSGVSNAYVHGRVHKLHLQALCRDGIVYVGRVA